MEKKEFNIVLGLILGTSLLLLIISVNISANITYESYIQSEAGFWLINIIALVIFFAISYVLLFYEERIFTNKRKLFKKTRRVGDDLFIIMYIIGWIIYGFFIIFRDPYDTIRQLYDQYQWFIYFSFFYIAIVKINHVIKWLNLTEEEREQLGMEKLRLFEFGSRKEYTETFIWGIFVILIFWIVGWLINSFNLESIFTEEGRDFLLFQMFGSIPAEEIVFRWAVMDIIRLGIQELVFDLKKYREKDKEKKQEIIREDYAKWGWFIAIPLSAFWFSFYHIDRYGYDSFAFVYIMLLAFISGFLMYWFGMFNAYLLHVFNNFSADFSAIISPKSANNSISYLYFLFGILFLFRLVRIRKKPKNNIFISFKKK
jgi:hypothetical protein